MCASRSTPNRSAKQRLAKSGGIGGQPAADPVRDPVVLLGFPRGQVDDVGAVEPAEVERLVEILTQVVEERRDQRQIRVAVEIARSDEQRAHPDGVQRARRIGSHPALRDERAQQGVGAAARHVERVADLPQACRVVVTGGEVFEQLDGPYRRLHLPDGEIGCRSR